MTQQPYYNTTLVHALKNMTKYTQYNLFIRTLFAFYF